jgi:hypothetical protein
MLVCTWPQVKTHKDKLVGICAGSDRHICVFNAFAVAFAAGCFKLHQHDVDGMNYLFPEMAEKSSANGDLKRALRDCASEVPELSKDSTGGSLRDGGHSR